LERGDSWLPNSKCSKSRAFHCASVTSVIPPKLVAAGQTGTFSFNQSSIRRTFSLVPINPVKNERKNMAKTRELYDFLKMVLNTLVGGRVEGFVHKLTGSGKEGCRNTIVVNGGDEY
jgi:hypothetical protein